MTQEKLQERMRALDISPSVTRMRIYEYVDQRRDHPTVDQIYKALSPELPTLSKTTVYNVLSLFVEKGLVEAINTDVNEKRYETYHDDHAHFTCKVCGKIYDIPSIQTSYMEGSLEGFQVLKQQVNLCGICPTCLAKK